MRLLLRPFVFRPSVFALLALTASLPHCQHARVQLADPSVNSAANPEPAQSAAATTSNTVRIDQHYFLLGALPRSRSVDAGEHCAQGRVLSAHQYSDWDDLLFEQLSLGIYSPRTLELVCAP